MTARETALLSLNNSSGLCTIRLSNPVKRRVSLRTIAGSRRCRSGTSIADISINQVQSQLGRNLFMAGTIAVATAAIVFVLLRRPIGGDAADAGKTDTRESGMGAPSPNDSHGAGAATGVSPAPGANGALAGDDGFVGVVIAGEAVQIQPKFDGRIDKVMVKVGDRVAAGDVIARLDQRTLAADLVVQKSSAAAARARLRRRIPLARGALRAITPEELESARYEVVREREKVRQLEQAVAESVVRAPFAGTIAERYLADGALTGPGKAIVRLLGQAQPRVRFAVPEDAAAGIAPGTPASVHFRTSPATFAAGTVANVIPEVDPASGMIIATADVVAEDNVAYRLSTGVMARVFIGPSAAPHPAAAK